MSYDIDLVHEILNDIVDEMDPILFEGLNGGIILSDETRYHEESINNDLVILGEYIRYGIVKRIVIYYGSLIIKYPEYNEQMLKCRLQELIDHELRHHVEYRAGIDDLIDEDNAFIEAHKIKRGDSNN